jgi:hypothetical protein
MRRKEEAIGCGIAAVANILGESTTDHAKPAPVSKA